MEIQEEIYEIQRKLNLRRPEDKYIKEMENEIKEIMKEMYHIQKNLNLKKWDPNKEMHKKYKEIEELKYIIKEFRECNTQKDVVLKFREKLYNKLCGPIYIPMCLDFEIKNEIDNRNRQLREFDNLFKVSWILKFANGPIDRKGPLYLNEEDYDIAYFKPKEDENK